MGWDGMGWDGSVRESQNTIHTVSIRLVLRALNRRITSATHAGTEQRRPTRVTLCQTDYRKCVLVYCANRHHPSSPACRADRQVLEHSQRWRAHAIPQTTHDDQSGKFSCTYVDCGKAYKHQSSLVLSQVGRQGNFEGLVWRHTHTHTHRTATWRYIRLRRDEKRMSCHSPWATRETRSGGVVFFGKKQAAVGM